MASLVGNSEELFRMLFLLQASTAISFAACLFYDIVSTLTDEATLVWPSKWSLTKGLYLYNRYSPIAENVITVNLLLRSQAPETCWLRYRALAYLLIVGSAISECILVLRTYALWEKNHHILWSLSMLLTLIFIANIIVTKRFFNGLEYGPSPLRLDLPGCFATASNGIVWIEFVLLLIVDSVVIGLTFIKGYEHLCYSRSPLAVTLYEDGLLYYICFVLISVANIVIFLAGPVRYFVPSLTRTLLPTELSKPELQNSLTLPTRTIHSMLTSHVILRIRAADWLCRHRISMDLSALAEHSDIRASTSGLDDATSAREPFSITNIAFISGPSTDAFIASTEAGYSPRLSRTRSRTTRSNSVRWGSGGRSVSWRTANCSEEGSAVELQLFSAQDEVGPSSSCATSARRGAE